MNATPQPDDPNEVVKTEEQERDDREDYLDGQEEDSFPASDPHSDWSGPPPGRG